jgi:hypothetical protein
LLTDGQRKAYREKKGVTDAEAEQLASEVSRVSREVYKNSHMVKAEVIAAPDGDLKQRILKIPVFNPLPQGQTNEETKATCEKVRGKEDGSLFGGN